MLVTLALTAALVASFAGPALARQRSDALRTAVTTLNAPPSADDATDDVGSSPVLEVCTLLAVLVVLVRSRGATWRVRRVEEVDSSRSFRHGNEPCRAPPPAAIA